MQNDPFGGGGGGGMSPSKGYSAPMPRGYSAPTPGGGQGEGGMKMKRDIGMPSSLGMLRKAVRGFGRRR